jgi:quercetin dioxygenase-like cupin family protein
MACPDDGTAMRTRCVAFATETDMHIKPKIGGAAPKVSWLKAEYRILLQGSASGGRIGLFEAVVQDGDGPPPHIHHNEDEAIHVLEGEYEFWLDGFARRLGPGEAIFLPRGVPHTFRVARGPGRSLTVVTPGGFENFFVEAAERGLRFPPDPCDLGDLPARYGIEFIAPARRAA